MRISFTSTLEGCHVLYSIGKIEAASPWHAENGAPLQENWREVILGDLIRKAEDVDADAIVGIDYRSDPSIRVDETGVKLKRIVATGVAVKLAHAV